MSYDQPAGIKQQLEWATRVLYSISCNASLDSEVLLAHCLQKDRSYLFTWPDKELTSEQIDCFHDLVKRRLEPQPVAYLVGYREFYSMQLTTTPATLVPRPETEMLVDTVLEITDSLQNPKILELGTGTGAISLALKKHAPQAEILATDISPAALQVAQANASTHQLDISFVESNWYADIPDVLYDVIVANPPYIAATDPYLSQGDLPAEPLQALSSGQTGLESIQQIVADANNYLTPGGWLVLEHGYDQQSAVSQILLQAGFNKIKTLMDFNDLARLTMGCQ